MNDKQNKKSYVPPQIKRLGKLSTLIQGVSGKTRDNFPQPGSKD